MLAIAGFATVVIIVALIGFLALDRDPEIIQGQMEVEEYRVSSKVPGRIVELCVKEGDVIHKGDTLAIIDAPDVQAKKVQAESARNAASAMHEMADNGAREETKRAAYELLQQAKAGCDVTRKTYERINNLYNQGVVTAQRRDEALAALEVAEAQVKAAQSQYDMARNGARQEERKASSAQVSQASGAVMEVNSYINETVQTAQMDGEVSEVYPKIGELVGTGTPIMSISMPDDQWAAFNIREDQLKDITIGTELTVFVPALDKEVKMKVYYMKDKGSFAAWKATKANGQYDQKTFEVKARPAQRVEGIRPGMSVILKKKK